MAMLKEKLQKHGRKYFNTGSIREVLRKFRAKGLTERDVAEKFDCSVPAIRHWLKKCKLLKPRMRFPDKIKEMGYSSLASFFKAPENRHPVSFKEIAKRTGFCYVTVSYWYHEFEKELKPKGE